MKARLIFNDKEFEVEITEEEAKKFTATTKKTGYERVQTVYDNFSAASADGTVRFDYFDDKGVGYFADRCYESANYYSSCEVAENNARADKLMRQLRRFAVEHRKNELNWNNPQIPKHIIRFGYYKKELVVCTEFYGRDFGNISFDSEETAHLAIDTFHDELIWYFTEYKDSL